MPLIEKNHPVYMEIAKRNYDYIKSISENKDNLNEHISSFDIEEIERRVISVVVFCAFAVEAFINYYAITSFSKNYFDEHLDKLKVVSKWILIPKLVAGEQIDPGSSAISNLKKLIRLRNYHAHYKAKDLNKIEIDKIKEQLHLPETAEFAINAVSEIMLSLKDIDHDIDVSWLEEP